MARKWIFKQERAKPYGNINLHGECPLFGILRCGSYKQNLFSLLAGGNQKNGGDAYFTSISAILKDYAAKAQKNVLKAQKNVR